MRIAMTAVILLSAAFVFAQDKPATSPSTAPSEPVDVVAQKDTLKELVGKDVTVRGKVVEVFVSNRSGITILNFFPGADRRLFNVVIDKVDLDVVAAPFNGDLRAALTDKTVLVTGKVDEYRTSPQIKVSKPDQIKIDESAPAAKEEKPAEEKK